MTTKDKKLKHTHDLALDLSDADRDVMEKTHCDFYAAAYELTPVLLEAATALRTIAHARDFNAMHGHYPPEYKIGGDVCFDDWAADLATSITVRLK